MSRNAVLWEKPTLGSEKFLLLAANAWVIGYFVKYEQRSLLTYLFLGTGLILLFWSMRHSLAPKRIKSTLPKMFSYVVGAIGVSFHYVKMNRRYVLVSALGLTIAVAGLAQAFMVVNVQEDRLMEVALGSVEKPSLLVSGHTLDEGNPSLPPSILHDIETGLDEIEELSRTNTVAKNYQLEKSLTVNVMKGLEYYDRDLNYVQRHVQSFYMNTDFLLPYINSEWGGLEGRFPTKPHETLVFKAPSGLADIQPSFYIGQNITIDFPLGIGRTYGGKVIERNYTVVGYVELPPPRTNPVLPWIDYVLSPITFFVTQNDLEESYIDYNYLPYMRFYRGYFYDFGDDTVVDVRQNLIHLLQYSSILFSPFHIGNFKTLTVTSPYASSLEWVVTVIEPLHSIFLFLSVPIMGISVFLVDMSFNLVEKRKKKIIANLKTRGASNTQLVTATLVEIMISTLLGLVLGLLLAIPISWVLIKSSGFMQFSNEASMPYLTLKQALPIIYAGIVLGFDYNLFNLLDVTKTKISEGEHPVEVRVPFWRKFHFDIILFGIGLWFSYVVDYIVKAGKENISSSNIVQLGSMALFFTVVGGVMFGSWFFSGFLNKLGSLLWGIIDHISVLSFKNLHLRRNTTSKIIALLMVSVTFLVYLIATPVSLDIYTQEQERYKIGADLVIEEAGFDNPNFKKAISQVSDIEDYTTVDMYTFTAFYNGKQLYLTVLGINTSNFAKVAFFKDNYASKSIEEITDDLKVNGTAYVWDVTKENLGLVQGTEVEIDYYELNRYIREHERLNTTKSFYFIGEFSYWPRLIETRKYYGQFIIVTNLATAEKLKNDVGLSNVYRNLPYVLVKAKPGTNLTLLREEIFSVSVARYRFTGIHYVGENLIGSYFGALFISINSLLTMGFIYSILVSLLTISIYSILTIMERKKEVGVLKALGMIRRQLFLTFLAEVALIILMAIPFGVFLGLLMVNITLNVLVTPGFGGDVPPITVVYPIEFWQSLFSSSLLFPLLQRLLPHFGTRN